MIRYAIGYMNETAAVADERGRAFMPEKNTVHVKRNRQV